MKRHAIAAGLLGLMAAACSSGGSDPKPPATTTAPALTAKQFIQRFKQAGLPVGKTTCFDEDTDPNDLLGRPGGYVEKCDWSDTREQPTTEPTTAQGQSCSDPDIDPLDKQLCEGAAAEDVDLIGGSIETYDTPEGARERAEYLRGFEGVLSAGYVFVVPDGGRWVLRIDRELPPTQAERYHQVMLAQF